MALNWLWQRDSIQMMFGCALLSMVGAAALGDATTKVEYQQGQIWEYRTRPEDAGSLLRIQRIEENSAFAKYGPIYHISVVGVHFGNASIGGELQHLPVSRETLDASVTRLSSTNAPFPDPTAGIAEWRSAKGGVFTIPLAEIINSVEQMVGQAPANSPND